MLKMLYKQDETLRVYSEWHHRREHVSQCHREENPGRGMVSESQGKVSHHTASVWRFVIMASLMQDKKKLVKFLLHLCACLYRMDQVIVHVGCMSLKDCQELVSCCLYVVCDDMNIKQNI